MVLINHHLPLQYIEHLSAYGHTVIPLPSDPRLPMPVSTHPDMLLYPTENTIITDIEYYDMAKCEIDNACHLGNLKLQLCHEPPSEHYPHDIRFNVARVGQYLFCHPTHTSKTLLALFETQHLTVIPTRQGYARCALCPVGDHALITADPAIANAAKKQDLDVLFIHQGHVLLPGYSHGFFGGCCGSFEDKIFICGDLVYHPNGEAIETFISSHGMTPITMPNLPLFDGGSLFFHAE